jgi:hypothetical protein
MPRSRTPVPAREDANAQNVFGHLALRQGTVDTEEFEG